MIRRLPEPVKRLARSVVRPVRDLTASYAFARAMHRLRRLPPGEVSSLALLGTLVRGWGNPNFVALPEYLHEVAERCASATGPVLECGSGLTTLVAGALAAPRGIEVWALEHDPAWFERTRAAVERWKLPNVHVLLAPLRDYGDHAWYDVPLDVMPVRFSLVVCDGPPGTTKGGRYGLVPLLRDRLAPHCVILLDDASRPGERAVLERWREELPMTVEFRPAGTREYAIAALA